MLGYVWLFVTAMDCTLPGFYVLGIFQGRILEWVAISSCRGTSWLRLQTHISCVSCIGRQVFTTVSPGKPNYFSTVIIKYRNSMKYLLQFIILQQESDFKNLFKNCNITLVSVYKFVLIYIFTERSVNNLV